MKGIRPVKNLAPASFKGSYLRGLRKTRPDPEKSPETRLNRYGKLKVTKDAQVRNLFVEQLVVLLEHRLNELDLTERKADDKHQSVRLGRQLVEVVARRRRASVRLLLDRPCQIGSLDNNKTQRPCHTHSLSPY